jgi:HrpA-like RNA helicase
MEKESEKKRMEAFKEGLPIRQYKEQIIQLIATNNVELVHSVLGHHRRHGIW